MEFQHFGAIPLVLDRDRRYWQHISHKPTGFWISVKGEDDWPSWCISENWGHLDNAASIELRSTANVLTISSVDELLDFHEKYKSDPYKTDYPTFREKHYYCIDWIKVANDYDGIIIAPYQWSLRYNLELMWYSGWDVASGCIWNLDAIKSVTHLEWSDPRNLSKLIT